MAFEQQRPDSLSCALDPARPTGRRSRLDDALCVRQTAARDRREINLAVARHPREDLCPLLDVHVGLEQLGPERRRKLRKTNDDAGHVERIDNAAEVGAAPEVSMNGGQSERRCGRTNVAGLQTFPC